MDRLGWAEMMLFLRLLLHVLALPFRSRASLEAEIVFLRRQLNVLRRQAPARPRLTTADRWLFVWLYRWMPSLLNATVIVKPDTIVRWHRVGFRYYYREAARWRAGRFSFLLYGICGRPSRERERQCMRGNGRSSSAGPEFAFPGETEPQMVSISSKGGIYEIE